MSYSAPTFLKKVYTDGYNYAGLFERTRKNAVSGTVETQYYFLPTNVSGDTIDDRSNAMNGFFSSQAAAEASPPYTTAFFDWQNEKYLSLMVIFPFENIQAYYSTVDEFLAIHPQVNNIVIPVILTDVFDSWNDSSTSRRQFLNQDSAWQYRLDPVVTFVKSKGRKVSFLVSLYIGQPDVEKFWGTVNNERDEWDNPVVLEWGNGHPSMADTSTSPMSGRSMIKDFFQKLVSRYYQPEWLGTQFNWISPVITGQMEFGYNFSSGSSGNGAALFEGYHPATISAFRAWLGPGSSNPDRYENITALNQKWGTSFGSFSDSNPVMPPKTGKGNRQAEDQDFVAMIATNRGKDFWKFQAQMLYNFAAELKSFLAASAPGVKLLLSFGGVSPNDHLVLRRCTYDVLKWAEVSDGIKTAFGLDLRNNISSLTLDYVQNYSKKIQTELNFIDYTDENAKEQPHIIKPRMIESGLAAIRNGVKDLMFITQNTRGAYHTMLIEVFGALKGPMYEGTNRNTGGRKATVLLDELLSSGGQRGIEHWISAGGGNSTQIEYTFLNTGGGGGGNDLPNSMSLYPAIQTYYYKDPLSVNSYYGRVQKVNNVEVYNTLQQQYNATKIPFLLSSHGITYPTGVTKTRSIITITDHNGVVWVKCEQTVGVNTQENGVNYSNNHPELRDDYTLQQDCRFWLPRLSDNSQYYDIKIDVFNAGCRFDVYHADSSAPGGIRYDDVKTRPYTAAGTSETIRLMRTQIDQENVNQRVIKINNNLWPTS